MTTTIKPSAPNRLVQPSTRFTFAALLAGLLLLLGSALSVRAQGTPANCDGSGIGITLSTDAHDAHIGDTLHYNVFVYNGTQNSGLIACDASNITASVTTPDGVVTQIPLRRTYLSQGEGDIYTNAASYVVRAQDVLPDGTVRATDEDHAKILQNDTPSDGTATQGVNTEISLPCLLLISTCTGGVGENGAINFIGTVTNCGNNTLVGVSITNYVDGQAYPVTFITNLLQHQIANFSGSFIPTNPCVQTTQTLVGQGSDQFTAHPRQLFSTNQNTCGITLTPGIKVTKSCPVSPVAPGQLLVFSGSVSNTGDVTLTNVVIVNNQPSPNTFVISYPSLAPHAISNFTGSYLAPTSCSVADTLTATGNSKCGVTVTNSATATCPITTTPQIAVTALCPVTPVLSGGSFVYSGTVQNTGNNTLTNVLVVADRPVANTVVFTAATMAPGAIANFTSTNAVPANACAVTTTFTGTGRDSCSLTSVTNSATTTCPVTTAPSIGVTLVCPVTQATTGGSITYTGNVTNSGNVTLNNVLVVDNQPTNNTPVFGPVTLSPHTSANFTATFTAPTNSCSVSTTVNASGNDNCTAALVTSTASATCSLTTTPLLVLIQNCPVTQATPGGSLLYSGTVSNAGNITLTNVVITNNQSGASPIFTAASLAPGAVSNYSGSYTAPAACSTTSTSTGTARSICGVAVSNSATTTCPITTTPLLILTQNCPVTPPVPGGSLAYSGTVSNAGNVTITNVIIRNDQSGVTPIFTAVTMAPGAVSNYFGSYTAPVACSSTSTSTGTGTSICGISVTNAASTTCPITTAPSITLTQNCPVTAPVPGALLVYNGTVRNNGNITLTNVVVVNDQSGVTPIFTAATMAPGAVSNYSGSYTAPNSCTSPSTSTGTATSICGVPVTSSASTTCPISTTPVLILTQSCPVTPAVPGGLLTYSGTVSNAGNITLTNVVIVNNQNGTNPIYTVTNLAPGAISNYTASFLAPTNCSVTSTSTGTGRSTCGVAVTNTINSTCPITTAPQITVTSSCPLTPVLSGGSITYSGSVQNTGNITLTNVVVVSDRPTAGTIVFQAPTVPPGVTYAFSGTYAVPVNACAVTTTFTGTGRDICTLNSVTNAATTTCSVTTAPAIAVLLNCPVVSATTGGLITYTGLVTNSGNVTLNNIFVVNNQLTNNTPVMGPITLAPGAVSNFTASFIAPANSCSVSSTVTARGSDNCTAAMVTNTASATCSLATTPLLILNQSCPVIPAIPGGPLNYSGTISNAGNITITNVVIVNNQSGTIFTAASMAPGAISNYSGSYTAPAACTSSSTSTGTGRSICGIAVTNSASTTCPIGTTPFLILTQNCPVTPAVPGGSLNYSGTVSNAGNIMLTNVVIVNSQSGTIYTVTNLAPGAISNYFGSYTAPAACSSTSTSTGTATSICGVSVTNSASTICPITTTPNLFLTQNCPGTAPVPGGTLTYSGTVQNTGNIMLTNVVIVNNQSGTIYTVTNLAPGAISNYSGSYIAPVACSSASTSTGTATSICGVSVTNSASTTCPITTTPVLILTQNCPVTPAVPGGLLTYTGTISNAGNITITNVIVLNNQTGTNQIFTAISMAPGAISNFTGSYLAPTNCSVTSISTGTGRSVCGLATTNTVSSTCPITTTPQITVTALCPVGPIVPGGSTTYSGSVSNSGNITLTNVVVVTDRSGTNSPVLTVAILAPGASTGFIINYTLPANACTFTTIFTATGQSFCTGSMVTNSVTTTCTVTTAPSIGVSLNCPVAPSMTGGLITYTGTVTNTGNVTLNNIFVMDNQPTNNTPVMGPITLTPHTGSNFTASFTAPINSCSVSSTVTATGSDNCTGNMVTNTASANCSLVTVPLIVLTQNCPVTPTVPGGLLVYTGTVSNAGNITLTNVVIVNNQSGTIYTVANLAPGAISNFTGSYLAPTACSSTSTSTGTGRSICGVAVTNSASTTCPIITTPGIQVTQTCPATNVLAGGLLTYTGIVRNTGNITLTNIIVTSDRPASSTVIFTTGSLAPGATANFNGSYLVPSNCCVVSSTVQGSGQGCAGVTVTDTDTKTCTVLTIPSIVVTKNCPGGVLRPGDLMTYTGFVSNSGDITLINVTVTANQPATNTTVFGPATMAPGEWFNYTASYVIPADFCGADTVTASGQNVCTYQTVTSSVSSTCPVTTPAPRIALTKNCPTSPTPRGGLYTYTGTVSNPGTVTLVNVYVTDNEPSNNTPVIGPITIAPGVTVNFTNSYIAPRCCCLIFDTLTARGQDRCLNSNVTTTASSVCPVLSTPSISVNRVCPVTGPVGSTYTYTGSVTNTGDVVLTNVLVYASQPNPNTLLLGPTELAPGEGASFTGSYTVTTNSNPANDTVTALGTDTCQGRTVAASANCAGPTGNVVQPKIISLTVSNLLATVTWTSTPGTTYSLQSRNNQSNAWFTIPGPVTATTNTAFKLDPTPVTVTNRFYQIKVGP